AAVLRARTVPPVTAAPVEQRPATSAVAARTMPGIAAVRPPSATPPATPGPSRRIGHGVVLPLIVGELALVAVLLVLDRSWPAVVTVACCGVVLGVFASVRVRGRLLCQWVLLAARFLLRDRAADLPADEPGAGLLALVRPDARCAHTMIGDAQAFLISDVGGIGAVLRPESSGREASLPLLTPRDLLPGSDEQALAYAVQLVHHAGVDRSQPPRLWLTLQALRTAEIYADDDVRAALANVVRRVRRRLRRAGTPFRTLTEQETIGSYAALAHVNAGRNRVREDWWHWQSGPIRHATFRLDGWSALSHQAAARLVRWLLAAAPDTAVTVSHTAHHRPTDPSGPPVVTAVLRIASSRQEALAAAVTDVAQLANEVGVTLNRLDGQHVAGMTATLPVGVVDLR
ncbi:type VII secretion protein EccE, partial [Actinophytocola sediminis]